MLKGTPGHWKLKSSMNHQIYFGDNLQVLRGLKDESVDLIYIDPPFNTGKRQARTQIKTVRNTDNGDRTGFLGQRYETVKLGSKSYRDIFDDYLGFLEPRLEEALDCIYSNDN